MNSSVHRFRLERVRALRERSEDQAKQALGASLTRERAAEVDVADAAERIRRAQAAQMLAATDSAGLLARQAYLESTESQHRVSVQILGEQSREVCDRRSRLVEAARARESLDRLADRSLAAHRLETGRREQADLDEIALNGFRRRSAA